MNWIVNDDDYDGRIVVGDTLECNGVVYAVLAITNDGIVVKQLPEVKRYNEFEKL